MPTLTSRLARMLLMRAADGADTGGAGRLEEREAGSQGAAAHESPHGEHPAGHVLRQPQTSQPEPDRETPQDQEDALDRLVWPDVLSMENLADAVGRACGMNVVLNPIPSELQSAEVNGVTVSVGATAMVYYDSRLSPLNRTQTILHELAHVLHGDICAEHTTASCRTTFGSVRERRAEITAMRMMFEVYRRNRNSTVLSFLVGKAGANQ
ncbi:ImmA/IrrE family metallo-endopeptidase [Actinomyces wuliandei]|uniref:ImmA/IrrE family metallo-endopeptidase n=1 Tax=Actinomyces wuliandei TaxID=2057743 RepID=UPI000FD8AB9E|nr:ImmA/IrrE family metallo-endopeptidase [Actinomyces wuliandei]